MGTFRESVKRVVELGYDVSTGLHATEEDLHESLARGTPPIVFLRTGELEYWSHDEPHAVVVLGIHESTVYLDDPAIDDAPQSVDAESFSRAWWRSENRIAVIRPR